MKCETRSVKAKNRGTLLATWHLWVIELRVTETKLRLKSETWQYILAVANGRPKHATSGVIHAGPPI